MSSTDFSVTLILLPPADRHLALFGNPKVSQWVVPYLFPLPVKFAAISLMENITVRFAHFRNYANKASGKVEENHKR